MGNEPKQCECGRPLNPRLRMCDRCAFLDGATPGYGRVVHALRLADGPLTVREVAQDAGISYTNATHTLLRMRRKGRIRAIGDGTRKQPLSFRLTEP